MVTFLFTDIVDSPTVWEAHPQAMAPAIARHDAILQQVIAASGGIVFKTVGDGVHAVFTTAADALAAALAAQHALHHEPWGVTGPLRVRMAIHTGAADMRDGDYFGPPLNLITHMLAAGHSGQILISHATAEVVYDCLPPDASLVDLGAHQLRDLSQPEQIFQLVHSDLPADFPPLTTLAAHPAAAAVLPTNLLATKLFVPPARANLVVRPRLFERLQAGLRDKLTLIAAPAGFGKTTLLSAWLAARPEDSGLRKMVVTSLSPQSSALSTGVGWVSLDSADNDPLRFWSYVITALDTLAPGVGTTALALLQSPQPAPTEAILTALLNQISSLPDHFILVLDDYHLIDATPIDQAVAFLLEHLPAQLHLVIATREDPQLPLARLRARGQLTELRATDLRFTSAEAAAFLNQVMGLNLAASAIATLETRTEGWIAGLQLAALSMRGHHDAASFITSFTGSHHFVLDYLLEEVLHQQSESVQTFLLRTAILDRLCGPLCDAVVRDPAASGQATLEYIEHANLFIVPLDNERRWYRYHHLFADLLRQRLHQRTDASRENEEISAAELHIRASVWYEENGLEIEAFHHAAAANDVERAERLIEGKGMPLHFHGAVAAILGWLASLPTAVLSARPALWVRYAEILLVTGQTTGVEQKLQAAEAALQCAEPGDKIRNLVGHIAVARATLALTRYQVDNMIIQSRRALEYLHPDDLPFRATANWTLGYAYQLQGDRVAAHRAISESLSLSQAAGNTFTTILAAIGLGQIQEAENQLYLAAETYRHVLQLAGDQPQQIVYEAHLGLARICYEWNDLDAAEQHGQQSLELARQYESVIDRFLVCEVFVARLKLARGDLDGAATLLAQADQSARQKNYVYRIPEVAAAQVLVQLRQGNLAAAAHLAQAHKLPISQARVLLAQGDPSAAVALLEPVRREAEAKGWQDERLKMNVLQAVAQHIHGETESAVHLLGEALALAEPGGCIRVFVDEGLPMKQLLQEVASRGMVAVYTRHVLAAFSHGGVKRAAQSTIVESLSERELEVLQHIAEGCTDREIADRLYLSLYTVKVHARNIYGKLGVNKRMQAVAKARELGVLPRS
jgi:LuxR family maltose regulon positive regulatory protein